MFLEPSSSSSSGYWVDVFSIQRPDMADDPRRIQVIYYDNFFEKSNKCSGKRCRM